MDINELNDQLFPTSDKFLLEAKGLVAIASGIPTKDLYIVWFAKTLGNWKALVSTDVEDGLYFEATHNGAKNETYIDSYRKVANICIPGETKPTRKVESFIFESYDDANRVLEAMKKAIVEFDMCTIGDFCDLSNVVASVDDFGWGWKDLDSAKVIKIEEGYTLSLPHASLS